MSATTSTCPACGADAFVPPTGPCRRCGHPFAQEKNRCPHCRAAAIVEGTGGAAVCAICRGPRIVGGFGGDVTAHALREQQRALAMARASSIATVFQGLLAAIVTVIGLVAHPATIVGTALVVVFAALPLLLALRSRSRAQAARATAKSASDRAWQAAAEDVAAQTAAGITASGLAAKLEIDEAHADRLLTALTVHDRTRIDVGDDAKVRYSAQELPSSDEEVASDAGAIESGRGNR